MSAANIIRDLDAEMHILHEAIDNLPFADANRLDQDIEKNAAAEGIFLRAFTIYENSLERLFVLYCCGKPSINAPHPSTRLANCTEEQAIAIAKGGYRFLDWSNPSSIRARADLFFADGEPFRSGIDPRAMMLANMEKVRNRIAHFSSEAQHGYLEVQRGIWGTERVFDMSPGQLLRTRTKGKPPQHQLRQYLSAAHDVVGVIARRA